VETFASNSQEDLRQVSLVHHSTLRRRQKDSSLLSEDFSEELIRQDQKSSLDGMDDYIVEDDILGSGQFGVVKKGHYRNLPSEKFAIKIVDKRRLWLPRMQRANGSGGNNAAFDMPTILKRELDILKRLDHPGIVRMHNFVDMPTQTLIVMDLASDGDLLSYVMARGRLCEQETKFLLRQVVTALNYLHSNGIVHRDLKPENLLLSKKTDNSTGKEQLVVKIADFGFATILESVTRMSSVAAGLQSVVGTPAYMSPEIVDDRVWKYVNRGMGPKQGYGKSADMWSLGVILYVCLGGVFPFDAQQPVLDQVMRGEFFFPDEHFNSVSDEAIDLICNLLVVNPMERYSCEDCLNHVWFKNVQQ
jgi:serine/threonine protein kinase